MRVFCIVVRRSVGSRPRSYLVRVFGNLNVAVLHVERDVQVPEALRSWIEKAGCLIHQHGRKPRLSDYHQKEPIEIQGC